MSLTLAAVLALAQVSAPTFSAAVSSVHVDVFVDDEAGPVAGLSAADFTLTDDGVPQKVRLVAIDSVPLTALFVFDTSSSVAGEKLQNLRGAARGLLAGLRHGDRAALLTFGHEVRLRALPTDDFSAVARALENVQAAGSTALYDALYAASLLAPERGRSSIVLFSDGADNMSVLTLPALLRALERCDVVVQVVAIGGGSGGVRAGETSPFASVTSDPNQLERQRLLGDRARAVAPGDRLQIPQRIAEATGGRLWRAPTADGLARAFSEIARTQRSRYILAFEPVSAPPGSRHVLSVAVRRSGVEVRHRRIYFVPATAADPP